MVGVDSGRRSRLVPFDVEAPGAMYVEVTGDFTGWVKDGIRLRRRGQDGWRAYLTLEPGEYQYRLRINGEWKDHAGASRRVTNSFGTQNCVFEVAEVDELHRRPAPSTTMK
jgi:1,4-alpha-glucan branching enzyme